MGKYRNFSTDLYLVVANTIISQSDLDAFGKSKAKPLPTNMALITIDSLVSQIKAKKAYPNPLGVSRET